MAVCLLALWGCQAAAPAATAAYTVPGQAAGQAKTMPASLHLNGTAYKAALSINELAFTGFLGRQDASTGWLFRLGGEQTEQVEVGDIWVPRTWVVSFDLAKKGLTSNPNGYYSGKVSITLTYDMGAFDQEVFSMVLWERGNGTDFARKQLKGWRSHDAYQPSILSQSWESEDFTLYFGCLGEGKAYAAKTLGHTLSYLPQRSELALSHRLYYDLPEAGETYIYSLEAAEEEQAALLRLVQHKGGAKKALPKDPLLRIDLSGAYKALENSYILLELAAN